MFASDFIFIIYYLLFLVPFSLFLLSSFLSNQKLFTVYKHFYCSLLFLLYQFNILLLLLLHYKQTHTEQIKRKRETVIFVWRLVWLFLSFPFSFFLSFFTFVLTKFRAIFSFLHLKTAGYS